MASVAIPHEEPVSSGSKLLRRLLPILGMGFLIIFALIEIVPFALTIANSLKCLQIGRAHV